MRGVVTIVVQPRERFSAAIKSLECLLARTSQQSTPYRLIYIDGGSPAPVAKALHRAAELHGFVLVRVEFFLTQHEAKNIALGHVRSRYCRNTRARSVLRKGGVGPRALLQVPLLCF